MMDDDALVYRDDGTAARTLTHMKELGVDVVRVTVLWRVVAENARPTAAEIAKLRGTAKQRARRQAQRFRATNPKTYPRQNWDRYDNLVRSASQRGLRVYFNVTGPGPAWAHQKPPRALRSLAATYKPNATAFKQFVTAVGRRFSGTYRDENADRSALPRVNFWSLWNEPNQAGWLSPQWERRGSRMVATSPALFRKLHQSGYRGLVASRHTIATDIVLLGETAPLGSNQKTAKAPMRPALFLRELARSGRLVANGYAHHPYTKNVPPNVRDPHPDSLTMANIGELATLLDGFAARGTVPRNLPLFMTEFGFETNPPDPFSGVPPAAQAVFNTTGEYQAWQNPRIAAQSQFLLVDVAPVRRARPGTKPYWFTYQSGLFFSNGIAKPSRDAYRMPFLAFTTGATDPATRGPTSDLWGQLRFLPNRTGFVAHIQWRAKGDPGPWLNVGAPIAVDERGYFTGTRAVPRAAAGQWRSAWVGPNGQVVVASLAVDAPTPAGYILPSS